MLTCALSLGAEAQTAQSSTEAARPAPAPGQTQDAAKPSGVNSRPASERKWSRWVELQTATLNARYRFTEDIHGETVANSAQHQETFRGRFKFDAAGRYSVNAGLATGNQFIAGWNDTGWGTGDGTARLFLKQLYISAQPRAEVEIQYGGLGMLRGEATELTTYDNDAYIMGERISVKMPKRLFFDEIAVTYAYLGDLNTPDIRKRYHRLKESNYHQFLVSKKLGARAAISADYTFQSGVETLRQAVRLDLREARLIDSLRFENYERLDFHPGYGFAVTAEKRLTKQFTFAGGYAHIDPFYGGLNADRFSFGHRVFVLGSCAITPEFTISTFYNHAVNKNYAGTNRARLEVIFSYDLVKGLKRGGIL